jgi:predicted NBD/HSP70 family sugar kinase
MFRETVLMKLDDNLLKIYSIIFKEGAMTVNDLMERTKMPRTTLNRNIKELIDLELLEQGGADYSSGGRPASIFSINPDGCYSVGLELSRSNIRTVICNGKLEPMWINDLFLKKNSYPEEVFSQIINMIDENIDRLNIDRQRFVGIGIGSVGPLDMREGILLNPTGFPNERWNNISLKDLFQKYFNIPVFVANGASTAVMGEYTTHVNKGITNLIYINIGVGIRVGVVSNGTLVGSDMDKEGAYGHLVVEPGGKECYCGNHGCIEVYSSIPSIIQEFTHELKKGRKSILLGNKEIHKINFQDIILAAEGKDHLAKEVIERAATYMGIVLGNIINTIHPQMIIIGGMIPDSSKDYYFKAIEVAKSNIYNPGSMKYIFSLPTLGHNTMAVGAAALVIAKYLNKKVV